jgi:[NiFe] hydrogenase assembly HybE family chaperone
VSTLGGGEPRASPGAGVREAYQSISLRMQDLPIFHGALQVELIGFREFNGSQVGVVVTPWFMNVLVILGTTGTPPPIGSKRSQVFPAGAVEFVAGFLEGVGPIETCSLFSPMHEFRDQVHARAVAVEAMEALFAVPAPVPVPEAPSRRDLFRRAFSVR